MMYHLNKMVGWCLSPLGMLFLCLAAAWVLRWRGFRRTALGVAYASVALMWALSCGVTTRLVGPPLERMHGMSCSTAEESAPEADAIVLLGGGMGVHEECGRPEMFSGADRVWTAARLFKAGKAPRITLSGGGSEESTVPLLEEFGVPREACMFFPDARNTEEESKLIAESGVKRILLVTSAWHMPRAKMMFERRGFEVTPCPADFEMGYCAERHFEMSELFPSADSLLRNSAAIREWVGLAGYSIIRR